MASNFESALFRASGSDDKFDAQLADELDAQTLRHLRTVSNTLKSFVDHHGQLAFPDMYVHAPIRTEETTQGMDAVAAFCSNLVIKVCVSKQPGPEMLSARKKGKRRSSAFKAVKTWWSSSLDVLLAPVPNEEPLIQAPSTLSHYPETLDMDLQLWTYILSRFTHIQTLSLRVPDADPAWPCRQATEQTLLLLRISLENARPKHLQTLSLSPIHAMGILHLRWSSFGAFLKPPNPKQTRLWTKLTTLDLRIQNPLGQIDDIKSRMFLGILHDYLRSFSHTLKCLKFIWLGGKDGPSPLCLEDETALQSRPPIQWPTLDSFWFGNITYPNKTTSLLPDVAPMCREIRALRSTHRFSRVADERDYWYDVPMRRVLATRNRASLVASSIYSQGGRDGGDVESNGGVSRTSRVVPFMLDVKSLGEMLPAKRYQG